MLLPGLESRQRTAAGVSEGPPAIAHLLPSLTDLAFVFPLLLLFTRLGGARFLLGDGDTGWHIRTGEWILRNHQVPRFDMFSFSRPGAPWFAWEWLWDVTFAILHRSWGLAGVVLASILVICCTSVALFRLIRRKCDNGLVAIAVTLLATGGCSVHWLARPHLFSLLFFTLTLHITDRAAEGRVRLLYWLIPLTLLWTNVHGGFFIMFLVLGCYIASDLLNAAIEKDAWRRRDFLASTKPWIACGLGCLAVTFANPYGWGLHKHIIQYLSDPYQLRHISEFQAVNFHSPATPYFEPLMGLAVLAALWDLRGRRFADVFLSLGWLHLALIAGRNLPMFAVAASPVVARAAVAAIDAARESRLSGWVNCLASGFWTITAGFERTDRVGRAHLAGVLPLAFAAALLLAPRPASARFTSTYDPAAYPEGALPALLSPETRHIFADDEWGDYLIYHLYPAKQVFIDGRSDFYGDDFGQSYLDLLNVKTGWTKTLAKYDIDTIVLSPGLSLTSTLKISPEWRVVYDDGVAVVFRRNSRETSSLVSSDERKIRDRAITKPITRDRMITQTNNQKRTQV
jgi:hypothetical protein